MGAATARMLVEAGGSALLPAVTEQTGTATADDLGDRAAFVRNDVTDAERARRALDVAHDRFGRLRGVRHCAGPALAPIGTVAVEPLAAGRIDIGAVDEMLVGFHGGNPPFAAGRVRGRNPCRIIGGIGQNRSPCLLSA